MRYAIYYTPPAYDALTLAASQWLGRNAFSGDAADFPALRPLGLHEVAYHTALPRRQGFQATLKAPFELAADVTEAALLRHLMRFAGAHGPFHLPTLDTVRLGDFLGLAPVMPCERMRHLAASVVQEFDVFRKPLTEGELELRDPGNLSAAQFANLYRWGHPYVMDEFRFHMPLTGPMSGSDMQRFEPALRTYFAPLLERPVEVANLALFVEPEPGAPFQVHSLHPLGRVSARKIA